MNHTPTLKVTQSSNGIRKYISKEVAPNTWEEIAAGRDLDRIVTACNAHEDLVKVLEQAENFIDQHSEPDYVSGQKLLKKVREVLAKAGVKP